MSFAVHNYRLRKESAPLGEANTNFVRFDSDRHDTSTGKGCICTPKGQLPFEIAPSPSNIPNGPVAQIFGCSPAGHRVEMGAIWRQSLFGGAGTYLMLSIPGMGLRATLERDPNQTDPNLLAIVPLNGPAF